MLGLFKLIKKYLLNTQIISEFLRRLMQGAKTSGGWVLIQNCHLSIEFCNEILDSMTNSTDIHEKFRIWITTESSPKFPISNLNSFFLLYKKII